MLIVSDSLRLGTLFKSIGWHGSFSTHWVAQLEVCLLLVRHKLSEVQFKQILLLSVEVCLTLQLVTLSLKSLHELLFWVTAIDVPISLLDLLPESNVLLVRVCPTFELLQDS